MNDESYLVCQLKVNTSKYSFIFEYEFENEVFGIARFGLDQSLSELHIIPLKQNVNGEYYRNYIFEGTCMDAMKRTGNSGNILERSMIQ